MDRDAWKEGSVLLVRLALRLLLVAVVMMAPLALAPAASAHSTLLETEPARDRVVEHPPERVLLRFDEAVESALGSVTVYDGEGRRVDAGEIMRPSPESVAVGIDGRLERGTYTVAWRVISADSDPINGAWVFHVQQPGSQPAGVAAQVLEGTPFTVSAFYLGGRFLDFVLLLACVGGVAALVLVLRSAAGQVRRRLLGVLAGLAAALTVVALVGLGLQAAAAGGGNLGDGFRWDAITSVADTRYGHFGLARAAIAAALCAVALVARRGLRAEGGAGLDGRPDGVWFERNPAKPEGRTRDRPPERGRSGSTGAGGMVAERRRVGVEAGAGQAMLVQSGPEADPGAVGALATAAMLLLAAGMVVTPGLSGHASVSGPLSVVADAAHVQTAAAWTGGLAFVVLALILARGRRWELAARSVPRFSTMAVVSVAILLVAGTLNGYLQVRAWRGLWDTEYGVLLLIKVGLVLPLLGFGAYNNRFAVPRLREQIASRVERRRFLRLASCELVIMVAVVGVTAALVNAPPARTEVAMDEMSEMELEMGPFMAHMELMPGTVGRNEIHLEFEKGRPDEVKLSARLESKDIGPLRYRARRGVEPDAYVVKRANLAPAGDWEIQVDVRRGEFDLFSDRVHLSIDEEP